MKLFSSAWLFAIPWTVAYQVPLSMEFSTQEYWRGCHFLLQGIFPTQGSNPGLPHCRQMLYCLICQGNINQKIWNSEKLRHFLKFSYWRASDVNASYNTGDPDLMPGLGRSPGEGNSSPLQYSCLENSMDRGAWQATVFGVARVRQDLRTKPPVIWTKVSSSQFLASFLPRQSRTAKLQS